MYSRLFEASPSPIALIQDERYIDCNTALLRMFGLESKKQLIGAPLGTVLSPAKQPDGLNSVDAAMRYYRECMENGTSELFWTSVNAGGEAIDVNVKMIRLDTPDSPAIAVFIRDETDHTEVRQKLMDSEQRFKEVASNAPTGIFIGDSKVRCTYANPKTQEFCGVYGDEILGYGWSKNLHPDDREKVFKAWKGFSTGSTKFEEDFRFLKPEGGYYWISSAAVPYTPAADGSPRFLGSISDISDLMRVEGELIESRNEAVRANAAKSEFLSRMSHELRTPLNAILGYGQLLRLNNPEMPASQSDAVEQIIAGGQHLLELIEDVLDFSRIETGNMSLEIRPVVAASVIKRTVALVSPLAHQADVHIDLDLQTEGLVAADPQRLQQVLANLLSNAIKFNKPGGSVSVQSELLEDNIVKIHVIDTGVGIPPEEQSRLFKPFERLRSTSAYTDGTGIGLSICRELMAMMKGEIGFTSTPGKGSDFWVQLPATEHSVF